jgi:pteridine reductase
MDLKGKHAFVTGAAKRVARAIAERLLKEGVRLSAHYFQSQAEAEALKALAPDRVALVRGDLRELGKLPSLIAQAEKAFGPIDVLVHSASSFYPTPVETVTAEQWDDLERTNLKAPFFLSQAASPRMKAGSVIVNIADVNGERAMRRHLPYSCSKAGLLMLTRNLAKEWAPRIRVNSISPGPVLLPESYDEAQRKKSVARTLLGREGSPEDIASAVVFLAQATYITGFDLKVDGGRHLV